jgi:hypothetical protein
MDVFPILQRKRFPGLEDAILKDRWDNVPARWHG